MIDLFKEIIPEKLVERLQKEVIQVTFNKVNGEERIMDCTLQESVIPKTDPKNKKNNDEVLPVWDVNKNEWRSFRLDSVTNLKKPGTRVFSQKPKDWGVL